MLLIAAPVFAQRFTAAIRGTVTDPTAGAVAGAKVTLTNENTGLTREGTTNAEGNYSFDDLPVGSYKVEVAFAGFKTAVRSKVVINVADVRAVNFVLETGAITESVSVDADSASIKTVGAEIAGLVTGEQVRELPLNGRNFLQLTLLQPGVTANQDLNTVNKGLAGGSDISVSGGSTTSNLWLIDGADNVDHGSNRTIMVYPSVDAIEEFKIQRNNYGAEFGQAGGAQINLVTRGGTNLFHGSAYYYIRRDSLNANNYFLEEAGQPKPELKWDDWGATFGGPDHQGQAALLPFVREEQGHARPPSAAASFPPRKSGPGTSAAAGSPAARRRSRTIPLTGQPFPGQHHPGQPDQPRGSGVRQPVPAAQQQPQLGLQQLRRGRPGARRVGSDQRPARLEHHQQHPRDGPLHPGLLGGRQHDPVGRLQHLDRRLRLGPAGQVARGPVEPEHRVDDDEHPDLLLLGQQDHRDPHRRRRPGRHDQRPAAHGVPVQRQAGGGRCPAALLGSRGIRRPLEPGPLGQQPGPVRPQGRLLGGVRQALREGRRLLQHATPRTSGSTTRPRSRWASAARAAS